MTMETIEKSVRRESRLAVFEHVVKKEKDANKNFVVNRLESDESSPSDSELIIDERDEANKNKKLSVKLTEEPLCLKCEWNLCHGIFTSWQQFNIHLMEHVNSQSDSLSCLWKKCSIVCDSLPLLMQHISYHGYLTKLKNIGQNVLDRNDLPACIQQELYVLPVSPNGYTCEWELCALNVNNVCDYFSHVEQHVRGYPRIAKGDEEIRCCWNGCYAKFSTRYKLGEHLRTHTKEKTIGCPTCSTVFSNKTKFSDHRRRQLSTDLQSYQCSQCLKLFPSERLLRDHMRSHINHYKCTMCDMTCSKPSILAKHIRFKHVKDKPFECTECDKTFVTKHNLETHLKTHKDDAMICDICDFKCRTKVGLQNHYVKKHDQFSVEYECHCCKKKFKRGGHLTKHLMKVHNYHWPSGHSRFRYRKDQDGIYRLQTVRYESLEVTEEMIRSETMQSKYEKESPTTYVLSVSEGDLESVVKDEPQNDVFITINDVDDKGNIVRSQVMKTKEIIGNLSDEKLLLTGHHLSESAHKEQKCTNGDEIKEELLEFVDVSQSKDFSSATSKNKTKRKGDRKRKPKSKIVVTKHIKTGTDQLQTEMEEFIKINKDHEDQVQTPIQNKDGNRKRKRKHTFSETKSKVDASSDKKRSKRRRRKKLKKC